MTRYLARLAGFTGKLQAALRESSEGRHESLQIDDETNVPESCCHIRSFPKWQIRDAPDRQPLPCARRSGPLPATPGGVRPRPGLTARLFHRQHEAYPAHCAPAPVRPLDDARSVPSVSNEIDDATTCFTNPIVHDGLPHRNVGALRLLRHGRAPGPLHGRPARFHRQPCEPDLGCVHRTRLCGAVDRRLDRRQGARRPPHDDHRRGRAVHRLPDAVGTERSADVHVRVARRDRRRQRPVQGQRGQPRAPHL